jgi:hypothetical protein
LLPGASEPDNGTHQRGLAVGLVDWELCRERSGQPVSIGQWTEACQLWIGLAELRTLQQEEEQYLHLACSRSFRDTASK